VLPTQQDMITVFGVPAHPLVVHAVVVLLPLATLGGLVIAVRASWRRRLGVVVLLVAAAAIGAVPAAKLTGEQLENALRASLPAGTDLGPDVQTHAALGDDLLPFALVFGVALVLLLIAGRLADRERDAARSAEADAQVTTTWRRVAVLAAALVAFTGAAATVQVVRIGHSGAAAVWQGVSTR
jgi:hypothetical protein